MATACTQLIELIYMSHAQVIFSQQDLFDLLSEARIRNRQRSITGLLLYDGKGTFIQAIEGPENDVEALFDTISRDERHKDILRLGFRPINQRAFADWQMAFEVIPDSVTAHVDGLSDFISSPESYAPVSQQSFATQLLDYYRQEFLARSN